MHSYITKSRILNVLLILTSLFGYLEWGKDNETFLFQAEAEILVKLFSNPESVIHPFTLLPMIGQILLLITMFQKSPGKVLTYGGLVCIGLLLVFMFVIGVMSWNIKNPGVNYPFSDHSISDHPPSQT